MLRVKAVPSLALIIVGSMDWLTTIIGIACFGAVEGNPLMAGIAGASLLAFTIIKLSATALVGLLLYLGEHTLLRTQDKNSRLFKCTNIIFRCTCVAATMFLLFAVVNNLIVVASLIAQ